MNLIKKRRNELGLSMEECAIRSGLGSRQNWHDKEKNYPHVTVVSERAMANALFPNAKPSPRVAMIAWLDEHKETDAQPAQKR